ncbi:MAG: response regulator transcription factor [Eubacteriales bacterium]|nr:response regulator transcription factor [Eubacteriales bacterium]MDD3882550.1 response regulator transcription factor [Eubacteriales bacterium]MDD4512850.1 response regulator transcription factor [Eubacteriales bacterium]
MKILVVDDEARIRELIKKYALFEGHTVDEASDGMQAVTMAKNNDYDIIVMDVMMPGMDGFSAAHEIRRHKDVPMLMLSARGEEYDRIHGFEIGVDDYVVKPFSPRELMLRLGAIVARSKRGDKDKAEIREVFEKDELAIDFSARIVRVGGETVQLSPKEYDLLFYLVRNRNIALSRDRLIREVWGYDFFGDDRTLDTHIKLLRRSLGSASRLIVTLRGVGYRFEA